MRVNFEGQASTDDRTRQGVAFQLTLSTAELRSLIPALQALAEGKVEAKNLARPLCIGTFHFVLEDPPLVQLADGPVPTMVQRARGQ